MNFTTTYFNKQDEKFQTASEVTFIGLRIYFCSGKRFKRVLWDTLNHDKIS